MRHELSWTDAWVRVLEATALTVGRAYLHSLSRGLCDALGYRDAYVSALLPEGRARLLSVASRPDGGDVEDHALAGTACSGAVEKGWCAARAGILDQFPDHRYLRDARADGYCGVRLSASDGRPIGVLAVVHDGPLPDIEGVTALLQRLSTRVASEIEREVGGAFVARELAELKESESLFRSFAVECLEGIWMVDPQGITTFVNGQMAAMLGYTPEQVLGRSLYEFMDDRARQEARASMERRQRGIRERHEFRFTHASGKDVWTMLSTVPLSRDDGTYRGALAFATDVTEWRGLELKVQHAQKLESLGVLAGGVAHDFNNLLVGILGNVALARRETRPEAPVSPLLEEIESSATRAAELTKQLLAYSGKGKFVVRRLDVNRLVEEMTPLLSSVINKKAALRLNFAPQAPFIEADATQVRQIVMNLVTNASDALGDRPGIISITTGTLRVDKEYLAATYLDDSLGEGDYVSIEVADTGMGMDKETKEKVFDPFFTTKFTGRGLGLAAVLGILRSHRGAIKVYSEVGRGSTFKMLLPRAGAPSSGAPRRRSSSPAGVKGLVLVADDEPAVREVSRRVLERAGYTVVVACDGREAVTLYEARKDEFVAVVLDMTMPILSGEEAFRELRRINPGVRVVLSSGYNEQDATQQFVGKGLASFLQKPWSPDDLVDSVKAAIDGATAGEEE